MVTNPNENLTWIGFRDCQNRVQHGSLAARSTRGGIAVTSIVSLCFATAHQNLSYLEVAGSTFGMGLTLVMAADLMESILDERGSRDAGE